MTALGGSAPAAAGGGGGGISLLAPDGDFMQEAVRTYLASPVFRAARYEELVLDDEPYRRPVRPDDLRLVDFSSPLSRENFAQLSGLMGHRMLLNIHDAARLLLPRTPSAGKWLDYQQFYGPQTRYLGDLIRPHLEAHLFGFVHRDADANAAKSDKELTDRATADGAARAGRAAELAASIAAAPEADRRAVLDMLAIQANAAALNSADRPAALGALAVGTLPELYAAPAGGSVLRRLAEDSGLKYEPHSYFQFYLPSTLAQMNYLAGAALDPGRVFALAGALYAENLEAAALDAALTPAVSAALGRELTAAGPGDDADTALLDEALAAVARVGGEFGVAEFARGLHEYTVLQEVHHEDRIRQLTWINDMPAHAAKARRLQSAITEHAIDVDLDTFVESWEECSTTHVHGEDRLLVIETGQMEFWNCFGRRHEYKPGDMAFIPKHRLHGSVVLSGECVYHQPVITEELDRRFG